MTGARGPIADTNHDWNASDADRAVPKPGVLERIGRATSRLQGRRALRESGARPMSERESARFVNVVAGMAERVGAIVVETFLIERGGPNALVYKTDHPVIAVTRSLLDTYTRTEMEAVVAHCLVRAMLDHRRTRIGYGDDVRAAALTRFPPALASAIQKAASYEGRHAPFYFVATGPSHRPAADRVAALADL